MRKKVKAAILIVDDNPTNFIALEALLNNGEREFIHAQSGEEALDVASNKTIDLILLDAQIPDISGFELAQRLKVNSNSTDIPVVFTSAKKLDHASILKNFEGRAIDFLFRPFDTEITKAKVTLLLKVQLQEKELVEKKFLLERSALLTYNSADILGIVDATTLEIEEMNPAFTRILGYENTVFLGKSLLSFFDHADGKLFAQQALTEKATHSFHTRIFCEDQSVKWLDWCVTVKHGKWFVHARDITEIKKLNAALEKNIDRLEAVNKELESFSYAVSHDLRAPLRAILGNAQILEEDCSDKLDEEEMKAIKKIQFNADRMNGQINDLLSFYRIGKKQEQQTAVNMEELVRDIFAKISDETPLKATVEIMELPEAYGDYSMLSQVWMNLISNAIKYSSRKENPRIEVGWQKRNALTEYYVKDNGAGFDMAYSGKLFKTFQRLHDSTEFEGTGIGLAIAHRIIIKHGGSIRAEAAPEEGATFYFTLPGNEH